MAGKKLIILLIILILVVIVIFRFSSPEDTWLCQNNSWVKHGNPKQNQPTTGCGLSEEPHFCTQEVERCPDGSFTSRKGPNCEFTPCPKK